MSICNMDCLNCVFSDCINDSDVLSSFEREVARNTDRNILDSRGLTYDSQTHKRQIGNVEPSLYKKAQRRHYHKKYYLADPEKHKRLARLSYARNKEKRLASSHSYYKTHKEEILSSKKTYYQEHREEILEKRKKAYVPREKKPLIDTPEAELKRQRARESYRRNKEEINRRRRERSQNASNKR